MAGYAITAILVLAGIGSGQANVVVFALGCLLIALLAVDAWGLRSRIPLLNSSNKVAAAAGWSIAAVLLFTVIGLTTRPTTSTTPAAAQSSASAATPSATRNSATAKASPSPTPTPTPTPTMTPTPASPTQPPGFVTFLNQPSAYPGQYATLRVRTTATTVCSIVVNYASGPSTAQGLEDKTSDGAGSVSWTWKVGARTSPGRWEIDVSCGDAQGQTYVNVL